MSAVAKVIPLQARQRPTLVAPVAQADTPEPAQLYCLIGLTFVLHIPVTAGSTCGRCGERWPCTKVRLAFRLREGF
jgi:hypothetical protein